MRWNRTWVLVSLLFFSLILYAVFKRGSSSNASPERSQPGIIESVDRVGELVSQEIPQPNDDQEEPLQAVHNLQKIQQQQIQENLKEEQEKLSQKHQQIAAQRNNHHEPPAPNAAGATVKRVPVPHNPRIIEQQHQQEQAKPAPRKVFRLVSFPKSGRTWVRLLLGKIFEKYFNLELKQPSDLLELETLADANATIPRVIVSHILSKPFSPPTKISLATNLEHSNTIILVRDPRDVVVSWFYELSYRKSFTKETSAGNTHGSCNWVREMQSKNFEVNVDGFCDSQKGCSCFPPSYNISLFLKEDRGSFQTIVEYIRLVWIQREKMNSHLVVHYENLQRNTFDVVVETLKFLNLPNVPDSIIQEAIEFASFENMRNLEEGGSFGQKLTPGQKGNVETYKTREGKIGTYEQEFSPAEIHWMNRLMQFKWPPQLSAMYL